MSKTFDLDQAIRKVRDFPKPGILFYDITSILRDPEAFSYCIDRMEELYAEKEITRSPVSRHGGSCSQPRLPSVWAFP